MSIAWDNNTKEIYWGNETLTGDYFIHVKPDTGNDTTGDGTENNPFATQKKATDWARDNTTNTEMTMVLLHPGSYYSYTADSYTEIGLADNNPNTITVGDERKMIFVGFEKQTKVFITGDQPGRDAGAVRVSTPDSRVVGITFDYDSGTRTFNYQKCLFKPIARSSSQHLMSGQVHNCHFIVRTSSSFSHANAGNDAELWNCSFDLLAGWENSASGALDATNCVFTGSIPSSGLTYPNNAGLLTTSFDIDYYPTDGLWQNTGFGLNQDGSQSNCSIYGGTYDWSVLPPVNTYPGQSHGKMLNDRLPSNFDTTGYTFVNVELMTVDGRVNRSTGTIPVQKWIADDGSSIIYKDA